MLRITTRLPALLLFAGLLLSLPAAARGQYRPPPPPQPGGPPPQAPCQYGSTQGVAGCPGPPPQGSFNYNPGYAGYAPPINYIPSQTGDMLRGAASAMDAYSNNLTATQDARIRREQWQQTKVDTRRKMLDEYNYEQSLIPPMSQKLEDERRERVLQARGTAPLTEIISGSALNELLLDIQKTQSQRGLTGTYVPLDPQVMQHIGLTGVTSGGGNSNFFPPDGTLQWPVVLQDDRFNARRKQVSDLVAQLVKQAEKGQIQGKTYKQLKAELDGFRADIKAAIDDMTPTENVQARRYVDQVTQAARMFEDPNVASFFNGQYKPQGQTVGELVAYMTQKGLRFAPASPGNEQYYNALYQGIVQYDSGLMQLAYGGAPR
jgi:hypothetical protein